MPMSPPLDFSTLSLGDIARLVEDSSLPPVDQWHPEHCGDSEMRIAADGTWYHQGSPIGRPEMVRLFSTILRREEDGSHVLVTPAEKLSIEVEDAPFVAVEMTSEGRGSARRLAFRLNSGDLVIADKDHPLRIRGTPDEPRPYIHVRGEMDALVSRPLFYELAHMAMYEQTAEEGKIGLWSCGVFFSLEPGR